MAGLQLYAEITANQQQISHLQSAQELHLLIHYILYYRLCYFQMQERQKIQRELERMREECVKDYLEEKLQEITSKEVIHDILQEFLQINNQEFMENISENILEAKEQNRALKKQLESTKIQSEQHLKDTCEEIHQQCQRSLSQEINRAKLDFQKEIQELKYQCTCLEQSNFTLTVQRQNLQASLNIKQAKQAQTKREIAQLQQELAEGKSSFENFKDSCEKIIYQNNRDKQREKQKLIEEWKQVKENLEGRLREKNVNLELQEELESYKSQLEEREQEISQLMAALKQSEFKFEEFNEFYIELSTKYDESRTKESQTMAKLLELSRTSESNQNSLNYLKEENNYLRDEIISFSNRYGQLEREKTDLTKSINQLKQTLERMRFQHMDASSVQKDQYNTIISSLKENYEETVAGMLMELTNLKEETQKYAHKIIEKDDCLKTLKEEFGALLESNKTLQAELSIKASNNEMHDFQINQYEKELMKTKQECRNEIEQAKQSYQVGWNSKNEELIEQRYLSHQLKEEISKLNSCILQLNEEIDSLKNQIADREEREKYYKLLNEEVSHFKRKLSPQRKEQGDKSCKIQSKESKIYFVLSQMEKQIKLLKRSNEQLRLLALKAIYEINNYIQQTVAYVIAKIQPQLQPMQVEYPHTPSQKKEVNLKKHIQLKLITNSNSKEESFNKTVAHQRANIQQNSNFTQIKKTLKNIHQRYQTVQSQNKFYSSHLDSLMKKA